MQILDFLREAWWISSALVGLLWIYIKLSVTNQIAEAEARMKDRMDKGFNQVHTEMSLLIKDVAFLRGKFNNRSD